MGTEFVHLVLEQLHSVGVQHGDESLEILSIGIHDTANQREINHSGLEDVQYLRPVYCDWSSIQNSLGGRMKSLPG